jgi:hypothetical protein
MSAPQTKFAGRNPFAGQRAKRSPARLVDLSTIAITDDPIPGQRAKSGEYKYDAIFNNLKPGQAVKCDPSDVGRIGHAMSVWIKRRGLKDHAVRSTRSYPSDGQGRVWLVYLGPTQ